jgi:hypothetical protein
MTAGRSKWFIYTSMLCTDVMPDNPSLKLPDDHHRRPHRCGAVVHVLSALPWSVNVVCEGVRRLGGDSSDRCPKGVLRRRREGLLGPVVSFLPPHEGEFRYQLQPSCCLPQETRLAVRIVSTLPPVLNSLPWTRAALHCVFVRRRTAVWCQPRPALPQRGP